MGKPSWQWNEGDLERLIADKVKESFELEYKESASLALESERKDEISKDVSAFANSGGGTLVYGIREDGHLPVGFDGIKRTGKINKEWLDDVIGSRIHPRIDGVRIGEVELRRHHPGRFAYVVYVPQSFRTPHQARDHKYYKRYNFKSEPMEDYEVRDLLRRGETPLLRVELSLALRHDPQWQAEIIATLKNDADQPAEYAFTTLWLDARLAPNALGGGFTDRHAAVVIGTLYAIEHREFYALWGRDKPCPVFRGLPVETGRITISLPETARFLVRWEVRSPRMEPQSGYALVISEPTGGGGRRYGCESLGRDLDEAVIQGLRDGERFPLGAPHSSGATP